METVSKQTARSPRTPALGMIVNPRFCVLVSTQRLERCVREVDLAARLGGDEFAVLLDGVTDLKDVTRLADRIQHELLSPFTFNDTELSVTASIGIVMMDAGYRRGDELLRDADAAMYRAKEAGRAGYQVFDSDTSAERRLA